MCSELHLHPLEIKVLRSFSAADIITVRYVVDTLGLNEGQANQAISRLITREYIYEEGKTTTVVYECTPFGMKYVKKGTVESVICKVLSKKGACTMSTLRNDLSFAPDIVGAAFGRLVKLKAIIVDKQRNVRLGSRTDVAKGNLIDKLLTQAKTGMLKEESLTTDEKEIMKMICRKRGASSTLFRLGEVSYTRYKLSAEGITAAQKLKEMNITGEELAALTPELLRTQKWQGKRFRSYDAQMPPVRVLLGRTNSYCQYLRDIKDKLTGMGFEEFDGPLVETEFWNSDALFMPQFHSARDVHDVYSVRQPTHAAYIEEPYFEQVVRAHEDGGDTESLGWRYAFDRDFAKRLILRSQGTVLSAKTLPYAKIPGKYFGVLRCFRRDQVDATHLCDFYQLEGIVLGHTVTLKTLLGLLSIFAKKFAGAEEIKYVPGYFPFTEPSVEVHIKHPTIGWFELGGSGIFRPEVSKSLGVDVPVLAWGLGIDRMALFHLGLSDLRDLFSYEIDTVRMRRNRYAKD